MTGRKRRTAIQVRVARAGKAEAGAAGQTCGLPLSGHLRRVGAGKSAAAFSGQRFHTLYQQVKEGLIKSARADCEEILRQNAARFCRNNCVYFKKSQQNYGIKFPQDAAGGAFNQCFLNTLRDIQGRENMNNGPVLFA